MFSYTFRKLSQQFCASFIFIESCSAFLFKVYINPNRIWDTLMTSKMELFPTTGFCKVILCRFMILYTHYCPMSVLLVPFCCRCFHRKTSEMVLLLTIAIANVVFYWAMLLRAQFLPTNFFFFFVNPLLSLSRSR